MLYASVKRTFDFLTAGFLLLLLSPVMAVVSVLLWLAQRRVLFKQMRPGIRGCPFTLYKFCSMTDARNNNGILLPDADRLTVIGAFIRRTSLDELPQLWNVLKGEMSLVGPRPLLMEYIERYSPEQARRHDVKPGITGWAQVNGRNAISWADKFALDVWYVDHADFLLDIRILSMTAHRVIRWSDISSRGHATTPKFTGDDADIA